MQARYFTAQCPRCHDWHPSEEASTHESTHCRKRPWARWGEPPSVLVDQALTEQLANAASKLQVTNLITVRHDGRGKLRSPHPNVSHRAFVSTVRDAMVDGEDLDLLLADALSPDSWEALAEQYPVEIVTCPYCGESVRAEGLHKHQAQSNRCHWIRADVHVTDLRSAGYADPWSLRPSLPLSWTALRTGPWRNRTVAVPFPRYNAVLVAIA